jgi:predicted nucleic acid-binding protein
MFIERHGLMGRGIGYVDALLLASAALGGDTLLWTRDRRLRSVAQSLDLLYSVA